MPNRDVHSVVGSVAGGSYALYRGRGQQLPHLGIEIAGGILGGLVGGVLPDRIDQPSCPRHRAEAHSVTITGVVGQFLSEQLPDWQASLRSQANSYERMRQESLSHLEQFMSWLAELCCRLLAGAVSGLLAGYASHLVMDAFTPLSLPLFC